MNRSLWAACAAILLAGTLTACSTTPANDTNSNGNNTNSGTGSSSMDTTNGSNGSGGTGSINGGNGSGSTGSTNGGTTSGSTDVTGGTNNSGNTNGTGGNNATGNTANSGGMNSTGGTPSGTSYVVPRRTHYPNGADQDRASYNRMTSSRTTGRSEDRPDGRYTAYSDGYVYPGNDAMSPNSGPGLAHDVARTARDMVTGVGDMFRDAGNAVRNVTGGVNDTRQATAGQTNASQRMGNNTRNTMLNANAE